MESSFGEAVEGKGEKPGPRLPRASLGSRQSQSPNAVCTSPGTRPAELSAEPKPSQCCGRVARPHRPRPPPLARPCCPGPAPPGRYRPRLPRLCLGVSPPASWQRSLRHWKSNRNPAASLLLRSLAIARSLSRQLSGLRGAPRR